MSLEFPRSGLVGEALDRPVWFVLQARVQCEGLASSWLQRHQVEAWFPTETVWRRKPGLRRERIQVERKIAPGYVFARFDGMPLWDRIFGFSLGALYLRGVVSRNGQPAPVSERQVADMALLPERLRLAREAEAERRRVRPGDSARVISGPLEGWIVDVCAVEGAVARILVPLLGKGEASLEVVRLAKLEDGKA